MPRTIHGYGGNRNRHPLYHVWNAMKQRCTNSNHPSYPDYGGRGIAICEDWLDHPATFIEWSLANGWRRGLTIDRRNNDGNYDPNNCRFVVRVVQNRNNRHVKLTVDQVLSIKQQISQGVANSAIASQHDISHQAINKIRIGENWADVPWTT